MTSIALDGGGHECADLRQTLAAIIAFIDPPTPFHRDPPYGGEAAGSLSPKGSKLPLSATAEADIQAAMAARIGAWMRRQWPRNTAKLAARDLAVSHHTTQKVLKGKLPENRLLVTMLMTWGRDFAEDILAPALSVDALAADIAALRARNERLKSQIHEELSNARCDSAPVAGAGVGVRPLHTGGGTPRRKGDE